MMILTWRKVTAGLLRTLLILVLLETGLHVGGFVLSSVRKYGNLQSIKQNGAYRILCLGESTTRGSYPMALEQILNHDTTGVHFNVIDNGVDAANTLSILSRIESDLAEYRPDMVVAMMGNNDQGVRYFQDIDEADTWIFRHCRIYRFCRIFYMHLLKKIKGENSVGSSRKAGPEGAGNFSEKENLSNETAAKKTSGSDLDLAGTPRSVPAGMRTVPRRENVMRVKPEAVAFSAPPMRSEVSAGNKGSPGPGGPYLNPSMPPEAGKFAGKDSPESANAYIRSGWLCRGRGNFTQAEYFFKKAIELDPEVDKAYVELGLFYREQDRFSQAEGLFKKAVEINPLNDNAYVDLGELYQHQGKFPLAYDAYRKAIAVNPKNDTAYMELGRIYRVYGEFIQAEAFLRKALELNPKNAQAYDRLGWLYRDLGDFAVAADSFQKCVELNPKNENAYFALGLLYRDYGQFPQAEDFFRRAVEMNPENVRSLRAMASLYEEMGKPELAKEYAKKAHQFGLDATAAVTVSNYRKLKEILDKKGIKLVCVQYPMRSVEPLKRIFGKDEGVIFVDNEGIFKKAVKEGGYKEYFRDAFAGDFGHCTEKGNMLLAQNIADVILGEAFDK